MTNRYSDAELDMLRRAIAGLRRYSADDIQQVASAVEDGRCPPHLAPFWSLDDEEQYAVIGPELYRKLAADPLTLTYSCYGFFPGIYERIYCQGQHPQVTFEGRTRGRVALFRFENGDGLVVKPLQSAREDAIARLAGDRAVGPAQLPTLEGFLVEELAPGVFFTGLSFSPAAKEAAYVVGKRLGEMVRSLHDCGIYYNDATISDPKGRSHLLVDLKPGADSLAEPGCRLIDFGVSVLLDNFPNLEPQEMYNLVRTTPEFRLLSRMGVQGGIQGTGLGQFLAQFRRRLVDMSREEILARDLRYFEEGLKQAVPFVGMGVIQPVRIGFYEGYR